MFSRFRWWLAQYIAPDYIESIGSATNRRVAEALSKMDPFEPLLKQFNGTFSEEYEHPEDMLDNRGRDAMAIWGWQQKNNPSFKYMCDWIMNIAGNNALTNPKMTEENAFGLVLYARAQIANIVLLKREIGRLALIYEDILKRGKEDDFTSDKVVE